MTPSDSCIDVINQPIVFIVQTRTSSGGPIKTLTLYLSNENTAFSIHAAFSVTYKTGSVIKVK